MRALGRLEELRAAVRVAEANVAAADKELRHDEGAIDRARAAVAEYQEAVAAGERPVDPDLERTLNDALRDAQTAVSWRLDGGRHVPFNPVLEAKLAGTRRALEGRQAELAHFEKTAAGSLATELAARARDLHERYEPVRRQIAALEREWAALTREWRPILAQLRIPAGELPDSPVKTNVQNATQLLVPRSLVPNETEEA